MRGSRKFLEGGYFCLIDGGLEDPNTASTGPSSARQRNAIEMAFRWRADDGPSLIAGFVSLRFFPGSRTSIAKNPYIFF